MYRSNIKTQCTFLRTVFWQNPHTKDFFASWIEPICFFILLFRKSFVTKFTFKRLLPVMYRSNMKIHCTFLRTLFLTKSTYKRILCIMNITNMCIQITFMRKHLSQNSHSKSLMNWGNMKTHATFLRKGFWKNPHTKDFFASWIEPICVFRLLFLD